MEKQKVCSAQKLSGRAKTFRGAMLPRSLRISVSVAYLLSTRLFYTLGPMCPTTFSENYYIYFQAHREIPVPVMRAFLDPQDLADDKNIHS